MLRRALLAASGSYRARRLISSAPLTRGVVNRFVAGDTTAQAVQVTREGDRLFSQATGQNRQEIFPESDRDFFFKTVDAVLSFDLDDDGPATQVMLRQDGKNYGGKRVP